MNKYEEATQKWEAKTKELKTLFDAHPDLDLSEDEVKTVQDTERELKALNDERVKYEHLYLAQQQAARDSEAQSKIVVPGGHNTGNPQDRAAEPVTMTLGDLFIASPAYKQLQGATGMKVKGQWLADVPQAAFYETKGMRDLPVEYKTDMTTAAGWAPQSIRIDRVALDEQRVPNVVAILPKGTTTQAAIVYMEETTFTNNTTTKSENEALGEAAFALTERTRICRKIGGTIPVTYEQLEDVVGVRDYLNNRMTLQVEQALETQVLTGAGSGSEMNGFATDVTQAQAKGTDPVPDAVFKGMTLVRFTGRANPTHIIAHPNDWQDIRLTRTAEGVYIYGSPQDPGVDRMWGVPVIQSTAQTENTILVGDFTGHSQLWMRQGIQFETTSSHASEFLDNLLRIKVWMRAALTVYRILAFCEVTGV